MKLKKIELPMQNKVLHAYQHNDTFLHKYFDYKYDGQAFKERAKELSERCFKRQELADVIREFMTPFGISPVANQHIEELAQKETVTVIGGQQAGILTGPLYSVHKAITVLLLAKKKREMLGIPVVPVFWVAGEDHDINEINHIYSDVNGQVMKEQIQDKFVLKLMASDAKFDQEEMAVFVKKTFEKIGETSYTAGLLKQVLHAVEQENTFTGFFVRLMNGLFADEGMLFIDAAYEPLRKLESEHFQQLILTADRIAKSVVEKERQFDFDGFGKPIEAQLEAANLFINHDTGRELLSYQDGKFINENVGIEFTKEEMLEIARKNPKLLSNNVVTRPLMQELLFPVLAFVGGAGELAYWAVLKEAFHHLGLKMPIFVPRISMTLVSRQTEKVLKEQTLTVESVMEGKAADEKLALMEKLRDDRFIDMVNSTQKNLTAEYEKLSDWFAEDEKMMSDLLHQNLSYHAKQFNYLKNKYEDMLYVKHETSLRKFDRIESEIYPNSLLQERIYHPYVFLNHYGPTLIQELLVLPFEITGDHYVIYL